MACQCEPDDADEKIEARRICLHAEPHTMAVVGEFRSADRVLASWLARHGGVASIHFEVTFCDGFILCGDFRQRRRRQPSLTKMVRASLDALAATQPSWLPDLSRYLIQ